MMTTDWLFPLAAIVMVLLTIPIFRSLRAKSLKSAPWRSAAGRAEIHKPDLRDVVVSLNGLTEAVKATSASASITRSDLEEVRSALTALRSDLIREVLRGVAPAIAPIESHLQMQTGRIVQLREQVSSLSEQFEKLLTAVANPQATWLAPPLYSSGTFTTFTGVAGLYVMQSPGQSLPDAIGNIRQEGVPSRLARSKAS